MKFNSLDKETKKQIIEDNLLKYEKDVYELLIKLAIDPESFDEDLYDEDSFEVKEDDMTTKNLLSDLTKAINALNVLISELNSVEE
jgi:hypothetical protein